MTVLDAREISEPSNADEVLAYWLNYAEPDDVVTLHGPFCRTQLHVVNECTCTPVTLRLGARAWPGARPRSTNAIASRSSRGGARRAGSKR